MNIKMIAAISALMLVGTSAFAQEDTALSTVVHYSDLDLTSAAGRAQLNERMEHALQTVCPSDRFPASLRGNAKLTECLATARASIGSKVDFAIAEAKAQSNARPLEMADAHPIH